MKRWKKITFSVLALCICSFAVYFFWPEKYPGYSRINKVLWKKLHSFGNDTTTIGDFDVVEFNFWVSTAIGDTISSGSRTHNVAAIKLSCGEYLGNACSLCGEFESLHSGDSVSYWLDTTNEDCYLFDHLFEQDTIPSGINHLVVTISGTYSKEAFLKYLVVECQSGRLDEMNAISKSEIPTLYKEGTFEKHGKISIHKLKKASGDSIRVGDNISIAYTTHLLDGTQVDSLTEMQFEFGKPGQLVGGLQFGLTKMSEGERALIYMPSELAFGEEGSSTGIIPPRTPVYFDVHVVDVKKRE